MNWFKKLMLKAGFVTKKEYDILLEKCSTLQKQVIEKPVNTRNFDEFIKDFESKDSNAMAYKLINRAFLDDDVDLLKRWAMRIDKAIRDKEDYRAKMMQD